MEKLPEHETPFIVIERGPTIEVRAHISRDGAVIETWRKDPELTVLIPRDALATIARIASLPPGGAR